MIIAGDIGGTNARLALFDVTGNELTLKAKKDYRTRDYQTFELVVREFLAANPATIHAASFGVAGPVLNNRVTATNLAWVLDGAEIAKTLGLKHATLLNDLVSYAYGALAMRPDELYDLQAGKPGAGNRALVAAGTGLGEGGLLWHNGQFLPVATEGGHADFAAIDDVGIELFRYLREKFGRVSIERVICGKGLQNVYEFLRDTGAAEEPSSLADEIHAASDIPALISRYGMEAKYPICEQALDIFCTYYGAEAGNIALKFVATGGVYVGGGIAVKILEKLKTSGFLRAFNNKGRFSTLLQTIPVRVILNEHAGLIGAARAALTTLGASAS